MEIKPRNSNLDVLMIDDDAAAIAFLTVMAKRFDVTLQGTKTPAEFLEALGRERPRVCLIDLNIGALDVGFGLIRSIRLQEPTLPLFVLSGRSDPQSVAHAIEVGATDFLIKPVDPEILASKIRRYVSSDPLEQAKLAYFPAQGDRNIAIDLTLELSALDEFGVVLMGGHLLAKGTRIHLDGMPLDEILGPLQREVTVTSNWVFEDEKSFGAYAEFDLNTEEGNLIGQRVQAWLKRHRP